MEKFNKSLSIGLFMVFVAINLAGFLVGSAINRRPLPNFPNHINVSSVDSYTGELAKKDFLNACEAADYIGVDLDLFGKWLEEGRLEGTYMPLGVVDKEADYPFGVDYLFSKLKLKETVEAWLGD